MAAKLLTLAASFRPTSLNRKLLTVASNLAEEAGATLNPFDYAHADIPLYREEHVGDALPNGVKLFADALLATDGLLLASPEYNWSIPGTLKNLIDWLSVDPRKPLKNRHALLMCASPSVRGGILGLQQLSVPLAHLGMHVYPHLIAIGDAESQLGSSGINTKDAQFLSQCINDFVHLVSRHHAQ